MKHLQVSKPVAGTDSLEDLMQQQQQKSPVAKNDSFERIGSDDDDEKEVRSLP